MLKLKPTRDALNFLKILPAKQYKQVVGTLFKLLEQPEPADAKPLKGYPYNRTDIGEYRVIYYVLQDELRVVLIGKRNDNEVYKRLERK